MALSDNCVLYWKLDETSWTSAADASWNSNTGTTSNITWATGKINNGGTFNGSSTKIDTAWSVFTWTTNFTIALWIKTSTAWRRLVQKRQSNANWFFIYTLWDDWKQAYLDYNGGFINNHSSTNTVNDWNWHLVGVSRNWNTITFWKDWVSNWWWTWASTVSLNSHIIDAWRDYVDSWNKPFNWQMDEIWIRTRELSWTERTTLYNSWAWLQYPFWSTALNLWFVNYFLNS